MLKRDSSVNSLKELINKLRKDIGTYDGPVWYRGQANCEWKLTPYFLRLTNGITEMNLIKRFQQNATMLLHPRPDSEFNWLFLMQHHGVPTRLLDWTESPLIAAYFACTGQIDEDAAIWISLPVELNKHSNIEPDYSFDIPAFDDEVLNNYKPSVISSEKTSKLNPIAAIAPRNCSRMQSQLSVFTISHRQNINIEDVGNKKHIWRYIIPKSQKTPILNELKLLGIGKFQLFPELQTIGDVFKEELH